MGIIVVVDLSMLTLFKISQAPRLRRKSSLHGLSRHSTINEITQNTLVFLLSCQNGIKSDT